MKDVLNFFTKEPQVPSKLFYTVVAILCLLGVGVCVCLLINATVLIRLKPPTTQPAPHLKRFYGTLTQFTVILFHCALVVWMQTAILCWWELALACATQHPPHSSLLHTNVPQASSHTANVQLRCLVIYSMYTFDTSAIYPIIRQL